MNFKSIIFIILLLISTKLFSQNFLEYYKIINTAEIATLDGEYANSDSLYQVAFNIVDQPFKEDFFLAARNADHLRNNEKVYNYLVDGIKNGLILKRIKELKKFKKSKLYKTIKSEYQKLHNGHFQTINIPLRNEIADMIDNDQNARKPLSGSAKQMNKTGSYNYNRLIEIIKENGDKWPGFSTIGEITPKGKYNVSDNIVLMLLHCKRQEIKNLRPYLLKAVYEGEMYPYHYARIIDYKLYTKTEPIRKGKRRTVSRMIAIYGTYKNDVIDDCEEAEIKRAKIGFEPLKDFYRKINSTYTCREN